MLDSEKIELINQMLIDFWQCGHDSADSLNVMLNAIATVVNFERKENT